MNDPKVIEILERYGLYTNKNLGQNFLKSGAVLQKIAEAAGAADEILEIGAGIGSLTGLLCQSAKKVVTVEIDRKLEPLLLEQVPDANHQFLWQDILKTDLPQVVEQQFDGPPTIVGNLPYYITTDILRMLLEKIHCWQEAVLMVQKEVADRLLCSPGSKDYRAATVWVQGLCEGELLFEVPPHCFQPAPRVHSAVIRLRPKEDRPDAKSFIAFAKAAFAARRKMFASSAAVQQLLKTDREGLISLLEQADLPANARAESFSVEEFLRLYGICTK
jgi:16S rRNA (adenine1518-N6/adenine1519-N6)-dimethyltransferase